jgi:ABC-type molybdate transport system ATPase subunit
MAEVLAVRGTLRLGARSLPVDLAAEARRIGVVGPSGAGKSTLLRAIAGLTSVGEVRVRGASWESGHGGPQPVPAWQRGVGFVPQDPTLFPHATVHQNLGWSDPRAPVEALAAALGLTQLLDRMPRNLSGGERQRVALGRGLLAARSILLLDEPFSALDRARRDDVARFVDGWARERDLPLVLVSHDSRDVEALTDEVFEVSERGFSRLGTA